MNPKAALIQALATLGMNFDSPSERPRYPYPMGVKRRRSGKSTQYTKKGPGRRHKYGPKSQSRRTA